jgi:hypothetical protein
MKILYIGNKPKNAVIGIYKAKYLYNPSIPSRER